MRWVVRQAVFAPARRLNSWLDDGHIMSDIGERWGIKLDNRVRKMRDTLREFVESTCEHSWKELGAPHEGYRECKSCGAIQETVVIEPRAYTEKIKLSRRVRINE